jgi:hypothetical protein
MATRRTTMKSRTGTKPHARAQAVDLRHLSAAEVEKKFKRATHSATNLMRGSMDDAVEAGKVVRSSMKEAVTAVTRASRRIAKRFTAAARAAAPALAPAARVPTPKRAHRAPA